MNRILGFALAALLLGSAGCSRPAERPKKIPLTTSSAEARDAFLKARDLVENLRLEKARPVLDDALGKDPNLAMAHLLRAQSASSANEYFEHLKAAVADAGAASDGEQLLIRAEEANAKGDNKGVSEYLTKLAAAYPEDERAHMYLGAHRFSLRDFENAIPELEEGD